MMPLEPVVLSFGAVLLLGLGFGSGPCNIACLPYLGPVFVATGSGPRNAWRILLPFTAGRLTGYTLLGTGAGLLGLIVQEWIAAPWVRWLLGAATVVVALSLLWRRRHRGGGCVTDPASATPTRVAPPEIRMTNGVATGASPGATSGQAQALLPGGLFLMGAGMALNPCAPLTTVILAAATSGSASAGLLLGFGFGSGAVLVPTLVFALGVAHFGQQLTQHMNRWGSALEHASVGLLLLMGMGTALGWIAP
ncbi:sulfite exporter TauE/SafE family protein [Sedimenticola hydrogenitrophicus]|uniref:urease accessory protein UreH domain-containing protein n=1 Tax=Sedimenticola hydrogenitrophicus TaxID=2967975 RepID=UPI0023AF8535|nr:sulfite exporter TauE/SafE family protein [Sedimenticola hydrogenitrophicus]